MKYFFAIVSFFIIFSGIISAQDSLVIQGIKYKADTIIHRHDVGLGSMHTYYRLPDLPLLINILEVDAKNPYIRFETSLSHDTIRGLERPSAMALRNSHPGHVAFAAINGDFYNTVSPNQGHPVNGQMLQGQVAKIPHNSRPVFAIDNEASPFIDVATFSGTVTKGDQSYPVTDVNNTRNNDNLILFNSFFGSNTRTNQWGNEVVLSLHSGSWGVNRKVQLKVEQLRIGQGSTSIPKEKVILSGHGKAAAFINSFQAGDLVELELKVGIKSLPALAPGLLELIGGDRAMLKDGVVQENNWPELHPRTAIGFSSDKSKIIMAVVDGRTDFSRGVSTKQLADIMKLSGASDAINLDGGGSSVMVVRNQIRNTPSDGVERAVGNALLVVSTAVPGAEETMQLNARHITIPFGKKFQARGSSFDIAGEVVNYLNLQNIDFHLLNSIGKIDENGLFTASGTAETGAIVGAWQGKSDTISVIVKPVDQIAFSVKSLVIDNRNEYTFKVHGTGMDGDNYLMDNDIVNFASLDSTIGKVNKNGVFTGISDGRVGITVTTGRAGQTDTCWVSVEIGRGYLLLDDFRNPATWSYTMNQIENVSLSRAIHPEFDTEMMRVDYSFTYSNRTASITLSKDIDIYGMPDSIMMEAVGNGKRASYYFILDHLYGLCQSPVFSDATLTRRRANINSSGFKQEEYPVPLKSVRLVVERDPSYISGIKYSGTFWLKGLYAVYPTKDQGSFLNQIVINQDIKIIPNPVADGFYLQLKNKPTGNANLSLYHINGQKISTQSISIDMGGISEYISVKGMMPGLYLLHLTGKDFYMHGKMMVTK
jgi:hypothetical protein